MESKSSLKQVPPRCGHGSEMTDAMRRQQELVMQLRVLVLPLLHNVDDRPAELVVELFDEVIGCNISVISTLEGCLIRSGAGGGPAMELVDDKLLVKKINNTSTGERSEEQGNSVGQKRRRNDKRSRSLVTHVPHYDGHEWRKYGQKNINGWQHPRSYYRCTYRSERRCLATKTVQQQEQNDSTSSATATEEIAKYSVVYYGDHTCKDHGINTVQPSHQLVNMDVQSAEMVQITTNIQEFEAEFDLPALLEGFDSYLINCDDWELEDFAPRCNTCMSMPNGLVFHEWLLDGDEKNAMCRGDQREELKQHHHPNNNMYLPGQSQACDGRSHVCDHRSVMKEITREQSLVTQLRAIVLPALQTDERSKLVAQMFQNILDCSSKALAELQLHQSDDAPADNTLVDDKKRVRRINDNSNKEEDVKLHRQHKRRRFADSVPLDTPVPHYDGRQWRKYGQKNINKAKHPRSYYRCTYRQEQGCKATKTVQQQDERIGADHPVMYTVVYIGQHTCSGNNVGDSGTDDSETNTTTQSSSDSQSSISGNCSDLCDHQMSLDGNMPIDKSTDSIKENMYEAFDMTAFAALDMDSWELDALLRFGA
ncbi:hypothetical protein EJB05_02000, partial [Eragrostis curvula]